MQWSAQEMLEPRNVALPPMTVMLPPKLGCGCLVQFLVTVNFPGQRRVVF
jgi:hypothetical protein